MVNAVTVLSAEELPDGVKVLLVPCSDYEEFKSLPHAVQRNGEYYGRTGWNSDRHVAYFRNDSEIALHAVRSNGEDQYFRIRH